MTAYRRADDDRWWPVARPGRAPVRNSRPMPPHAALEVRLTDGTESRHAGLESDPNYVWGFGPRPVPLRLVSAWRYQLPPTFLFPGDKPGSWECPDALYDGYEVRDAMKHVAIDVYVEEKI